LATVNCKVSAMDKVEQDQDREVHRDVVIRNPQGLHARPVMQFVDLANQFQCDVFVFKGDMKVDGKSPMEMMLLEATQGTPLRIVAKGPDADKAVEALAELVEKGFHQED